MRMITLEKFLYCLELPTGGYLLGTFRALNCALYLIGLGLVLGNYDLFARELKTSEDVLAKFLSDHESCKTIKSIYF